MSESKQAFSPLYQLLVVHLKEAYRTGSSSLSSVFNDLSDNSNHSNQFFFADNSELNCKTSCSDLHFDVESFNHWCTQKGRIINKEKFNFIVFNGKFPE